MAAHIRTIKHDHLLDEDVGALSGDHMVLWLGLKILSDREGRVEFKPKKIKAAIFPYRDVDVMPLLGDLEELNKIQIYENSGRRYIYWIGFEEDERIHPNEAKTKIPEPPGLKCNYITRSPATLKDGSQSSNDDYSLPFPSHPFPSKEGVQGEKEKTPEPKTPVPGPEDLQALWNELKAPVMPEWVELTPERREKAKARLKERPLRGERSWQSVIIRLSISDFATGKIAGTDGRTWIADPEFLLQRGSATKTLEGKYDNRDPPKKDLYGLKVGAPQVPEIKCEYEGCELMANGKYWKRWCCPEHGEWAVEEHEMEKQQQAGAA